MEKFRKLEKEVLYFLHLYENKHDKKQAEIRYLMISLKKQIIKTNQKFHLPENVIAFGVSALPDAPSKGTVGYRS